MVLALLVQGQVAKLLADDRSGQKRRRVGVPVWSARPATCVRERLRDRRRQGRLVLCAVGGDAVAVHAHVHVQVKKQVHGVQCVGYAPRTTFGEENGGPGQSVVLVVAVCARARVRVCVVVVVVVHGGGGGAGLQAPQRGRSAARQVKRALARPRPRHSNAHAPRRAGHRHSPAPTCRTRSNPPYGCGPPSRLLHPTTTAVGVSFGRRQTLPAEDVKTFV